MGIVQKTISGRENRSLLQHGDVTQYISYDTSQTDVRGDIRYTIYRISEVNTRGKLGCKNGPSESQKSDAPSGCNKSCHRDQSSVCLVHYECCDQNGPFIFPFKWDISVLCFSSDTLEHQIEWYGNNAVLNSTKMRL